MIPDFQGNIIKELNEVEVYKISPLETIPFVNNFIDRIYEVIGNHESLKEKIYYSLSDSLMAEGDIVSKKVSKKAKEADEDWLKTVPCNKR
ncbi:MAG: hypothetical protein IPN14_00165 [Bacteroidetes bacterium]|nr:hypothetical protein [Bacteroidota bacterium]